MFQSNTSKEILYIFLWLMGIIFFYALVHTFILEPSQNKNEKSPAKHLQQTQITHADTHLVSKEKIHTETNIEKPSIPEKIKTSIQKPLKNKTNTHTVEKKELQAVKPKTIPIPSIPKISETPQNKLSTPSTPNVPSIPTLPSVKEVEKKQNTVVSMPVKQMTVEKTLDKNINVKRIETNRQQARQEAEDVRNEAIKLLGL